MNQLEWSSKRGVHMRSKGEAGVLPVCTGGVGSLVLPVCTGGVGSGVLPVFTGGVGRMGSIPICTDGVETFIQGFTVGRNYKFFFTNVIQQ